MKTKSLVIGSAVAFAAATGAAQAADTVVFNAAPEPVNYVRVCDVYGAGFFYIPGTETCLKIGGYVWYQVGTSSNGGTPPYNWPTNRWGKSSRARLDIDARSETAWGTLRAFARIQADWEANGVANDGSVGQDQAIIELGGLRVGYTEGAWVNEQYGGRASFGSLSWWGLYYNYQERQLVAYSFHNASGFHATLSLENDTVYGSGAAGSTTSSYGRGYMPDVVGVVGISQGWGDVWAKVAYDESINAALQSAWAAQLGADVNVMKNGELRVIGYYASGDSQYGVPGPLAGQFSGLTQLGASQWSVEGSFRYKFTPTFAGEIGGQYFSNTYALMSHTTVAGTSAWAGELEATWTPVTNLEFRAGYVHQGPGPGRIERRLRSPDPVPLRPADISPAKEGDEARRETAGSFCLREQHSLARTQCRRSMTAARLLASRCRQQPATCRYRLRCPPIRARKAFSTEFDHPRARRPELIAAATTRSEWASTLTNCRNRMLSHPVLPHGPDGFSQGGPQ